MQKRKSRPEGNRAAEPTSLPEDTLSLSTRADRAAVTLHVTGVHVVVVETTAGRYRRRVYFNLPGAQRAADRAIEAGHSAHVILCQLVPASGGAS